VGFKADRIYAGGRERMGAMEFVGGDRLRGVKEGTNSIQLRDNIRFSYYMS